MKRLTQPIGSSACLIVLIGYVMGNAARLSAEDVYASRQNLKHWLLRPQSDVPIGEVEALSFGTDADARLHLFAAGRDKCIHSWLIDTSATPVSMSRAGIIHWPIAHGARGQVLAAAARRNREGILRLAFGGFGYNAAQVNIADITNATHDAVLFDITMAEQAYAHVGAIAFHPNADRVAVGYSGFPGRDNAEVRLWSVTGGTQPLSVLHTSLSAAECLDFNPTGSRLAVSSAFQTGRIEVWDVSADGKVSLLRHHDLPAPITAVRWLDDRTWLAATWGNGVMRSDNLETQRVFRVTNQTGQMIECAMTDPTGGSSPTDPSATVHRLADGESLTNSRQTELSIMLREAGAGSWTIRQRIDVRIMPKCEIRMIRKPDEEQAKPRLVSVSDVSTLAVSRECDRVLTSIHDVARSQAYGMARTELIFESMRTGRRLSLGDSEFDGVVRTVAFAHDGRLIAAAGRTSAVHGAQIRIWSTRDGRLLTVLPENDRVSTGGAVIDEVHATTLDSGAHAIDFQWRGIEQGQRFEFGRSDPLQPVTFPHSSARYTWNDRSADSFAVLDPDGREVTVLPKTSVWPTAVAAFEKKGRRYVAVALDYTILVWDVQAANGVRKELLNRNPLIDWFWRLSQTLRRGFIGHESGTITCLSVSSDANWLVSGADDGTIRTWDLRRIDDESASDSESFESDRLGTGFTTTSETVTVVRDPDSGSLGWLAGLRAGQRIVKLGLRDQTDLGRVYWKQFLQHPIPAVDLFLDVVDSDGNPSHVWTNALQDPLWTLLPLQNGHWVLWTPSSHFTHSDDLNGTHIRDSFYWHVNAGDRYARHEDMQFAAAFPAKKFWNSQIPGLEYRKQHSNPFPSLAWEPPGNLGPTVTISRLRRLNAVDSNSATSVDLTRGVDRLEKPEDLSLNVTVTQTAGEVLSGVEVWCNGRCLNSETARPGTHEGVLTDLPVSRRYLSTRWPNRLHAFVSSHLVDERGVSLPLNDKDSWQLSIDGPPPPSRLHYLGIGVTRLEHNADLLEEELSFADEDAKLLGDALEKLCRQPDSAFQAGTFQYLIHGHGATPPTHSAVVDALKELVRRFEVHKTIGADDMLCVLIACHARTSATGLQLIVEDTRGDLSNSLDFAEVLDQLTQLPCPILLLIDACHSGGVASNRAFAGSRVFDVGPQLLVSSRARQKSWECDRLQETAGGWVGHGLFTAALIEALEGRQVIALDSSRMTPLNANQLDRNHDGYLNVDELAGYVQTRVPELHAQLIQSGRMSASGDTSYQTPDILPSLSFPAREIRLRQIEKSGRR